MTCLLSLIHSVQGTEDEDEEEEDEEEKEEEAEGGKCWEEVYRIVAEGPKGTSRPSSSQPVGRR